MADSRRWLTLLLVALLAGVPPLAAEPTDLTVDYFGLPTCHECREFLDTTWEDLRRQAFAQGLTLRLVEHDILEPEAFSQMKALLGARKTPFTGVPVLVAGDRVLQGNDLAPDRLGPLLGVGASSLGLPVADPGLPAPAVLTWAVVGLAGLVDGINPCVLTLLVFLLSVWKVDRGQGLVLGSAYAAGVFFCYTAVGLGLLQAAALASTVPWLGTTLSLVTVAALMGLAGLSLWDAYRAHRGRTGSMTLKLPRVLDQAVRALIRSRRGLVIGIPAAFGLGAAISLLEFVCTGQVYLPTLVYLNQTGEEGALVLLLWYNFAFVVPLLVVFALIHWGTGHQTLVRWVQSNVAFSKILLAAVYGVLGLALLLSL